METVRKIEKIIAEKGTPEKVYLGDEELFDSVKNIKELEGVPVKVNGLKYRNKNVLLQYPEGPERITSSRRRVIKPKSQSIRKDKSQVVKKKDEA